MLALLALGVAAAIGLGFLQVGYAERARIIRWEWEQNHPAGEPVPSWRDLYWRLNAWRFQDVVAAYREAFPADGDIGLRHWLAPLFGGAILISCAVLMARMLALHMAQ